MMNQVCSGKIAYFVHVASAIYTCLCLSKLANSKGLLGTSVWCEVVVRCEAQPWSVHPKVMLCLQLQAI